MGIKPQSTPPPIVLLPPQHTSSPSQCTSPHNYYTLPSPNSSVPHTPDPAIHLEISLLHAAVVDLTNLIRSTDEDSKQMLCNLREEFSSSIYTLSTSVEVLTEAVTGPPAKKEKAYATDIEVALVHTDWIKSHITRNLLDYPNLPARLSSYSHRLVLLTPPSC